MPKASVTTKIHQTLYMHRDFTTKVTLDLEVLVDALANFTNVVLIEIIRLFIGRNLRELANLIRVMRTNTKNVLERDDCVLATRKVDACDTCHVYLLPLSLPLLVARIFAQDTHDAFTADDLALVTNLFDAWSNFHGILLFGFFMAGLKGY